MELFQLLLPYLFQLILFFLFFAINHYYVKDLKKTLKIYLLVMLPLLAIGILLMEFGFLPTEF